MLNYNAAILNAVALAVGNTRYREMADIASGGVTHEKHLAEERGFLRAIGTIYGVDCLDVHDDFIRELAFAYSNIKAAQDAQG